MCCASYIHLTVTKYLAGTGYGDAFTLTCGFSPSWWRRHGQAVQCMKASTDGIGCLCSGKPGCRRRSRTQVPSNPLLPVRSHLLKDSQVPKAVTLVGNISLCYAFQTHLEDILGHHGSNSLCWSSWLLLHFEAKDLENVSGENPDVSDNLSILLHALVFEGRKEIGFLWVHVCYKWNNRRTFTKIQTLPLTNKPHN